MIRYNIILSTIYKQYIMQRYLIDKYFTIGHVHVLRTVNKKRNMSHFYLINFNFKSRCFIYQNFTSLFQCHVHIIKARPTNVLIQKVITRTVRFQPYTYNLEANNIVYKEFINAWITCKSITILYLRVLSLSLVLWHQLPTLTADCVLLS